MKGNIIWIASYPKSGNTWFRIFLSCLLEETTSEADVNQIGSDEIASSRTIFEQCTGLDSTNLTLQEITELRPAVYDYLSATLQNDLKIKVHDAYQILPNGIPLFSATATKATCYLIRNPLDIAASYAHHCGDTLDKTIDKMNNPDWSLGKQTLNATAQLPHFLGSWCHHVKSWMESTHFPVCLLRYEDMHLHPLETFSKAVVAIGIEKSPEEITRAIKASSFEKLKKQEQESGFRERPHTSNLFFRSGKIGSWRDSLTEKQASLIIENHTETMRQYGYLDNQGNPIF